MDIINCNNQRKMDTFLCWRYITRRLIWHLSQSSIKPSKIVLLLLVILLERANVSLLLLSAKHGNYWYHLCNVLGMTRSVIVDWTRDLPPLETSIHNLIRLGSFVCWLNVGSVDLDKKTYSYTSQIDCHIVFHEHIKLDCRHPWYNTDV